MKATWIGRFSLVAACGALFGLPSCASADGKREGETHFLCQSDEQCRSNPEFGAGYECVATSCKKVETKQPFSVCDAGASMTCYGPGGCVGTWNCDADAGANVCECSRVEKDASVVGLHPMVRVDDGGGCWESSSIVDLLGQGLYVMIDQSQKMTERVPGSPDTWWDAVAGGITTFANSSLIDAVSMGIQYFPLGSAPDSCQAQRYETPEVDLPQLAGDPAAVATSLAGHSPSGSSSIGPALIGALTRLNAPDAGRAGRFSKVVLVTNGPPVDCAPATVTELAALAGGAENQTNRITTYVIALGDAAHMYDAFDQAVASVSVIAVPGGDVRLGVSDAFEKIIDVGMTCRWDLPNPTTVGSYDLSAVFASFELYSGKVSAVTRVASAADCSQLDRDGFYMDQSVSPPQLVVCPNLCAHPRSHRFAVSNCPK